MQGGDIVKRIYVEWIDSRGTLRNGNIIGQFTVHARPDGEMTVNTWQLTKAEIRNTDTVRDDPKQ